MNPVIVINVNMGSMGHRVGRLIASCTNILWYDHKGNGVVPWETCSEILNADIANTDGSAGAASLDVNGATNLGANVVTTGAQIYTGATERPFVNIGDR